MAKKQKSATSAAAVPSVLERSYLAYQAGDVVTARKGAHQVITSPAPDDEDYARETLSELLFVPAREAGAQECARELATLTQVLPKTYLFAGLTAVIYLLMLYFASRY